MTEEGAEAWLGAARLLLCAVRVVTDEHARQTNGSALQGGGHGGAATRTRARGAVCGPTPARPRARAVA